MRRRQKRQSRSSSARKSAAFLKLKSTTRQRDRCRPVVLPSELRCAPTGNALYLFFLHAITGFFSSQRGGYTHHLLTGPLFHKKAASFFTNPCICHTSKKWRGWGGILLTKFPTREFVLSD